jgi:hypothetical protein
MLQKKKSGLIISHSVWWNRVKVKKRKSKSKEQNVAMPSMSPTSSYRIIKLEKCFMWQKRKWPYKPKKLWSKKMKKKDFVKCLNKKYK